MQIQPVSKLAVNYGVKSIVYGPPGRGKTPVSETAPRPILCVSEPGILSLRKSNLPALTAYTAKDIADFYSWLAGSREAANYDTVCVDSLSQQAEIILTLELGRNKDGRKAYGEMYRTMAGYLNQLYFTQYKHTYLICKQAAPVEENFNQVVRPYFPGKELGVFVPHLFDLILHLDIFNIPSVGLTKAFHTVGTTGAIARDRSGTLAEYEPTDLTQLFNKVMKG